MYVLQLRISLELQVISEFYAHRCNIATEVAVARYQRNLH